MELRETTDSIKSKSDFVSFIDELLLDYKYNKEKWENNSLETFLEALSGYTDDIEGYYKNNSIDVNLENPSWRVFADCLYGARIYE